MISMGPRPHLWSFANKSACLAPKSQVSMGPCPHLWLVHANQRLSDQNYKSLWVPALICGFCKRNSDFRTRMTSLYGSQTSRDISSMQESMISTRITSHHGPSHHLWFCAFKIAYLAPELQVSLGPRPRLSFCACKTARLSSDLLVSMGPCLHLWFLHVNQRLWDQNYKSLWVPALICGF